MVESRGIRDVHDFWNVQACGSHYVDAEPRSLEFFRRYREYRYASEWHIPLIVPFDSTKGESVLEIGCGNGADGVTFAQAGALYTGVDLTEEAVRSTAEHLRLLGLEGTTIVADAGKLPFDSESFDLVYSHGVLHHMPDPEKGLDEVYRVLRRGGRVIIMLYHRASFNYVVRIMGYMRLRVALRILSRAGRWGRDRRGMRPGADGVQGNSDPRIWDLHYRGFLREGWPYLRADRFVHHATDGPECPYAFVYSRKDIRRLFERYDNLRLTVAHLPLRRTRLGTFVPRWLEKRLAAIGGWYLFASACKPKSR